MRALLLSGVIGMIVVFVLTLIANTFYKQSQRRSNRELKALWERKERERQLAANIRKDIGIIMASEGATVTVVTMPPEWVREKMKNTLNVEEPSSSVVDRKSRAISFEE
jgi:hypothetical protein